MQYLNQKELKEMKLILILWYYRSLKEGLYFPFLHAVVLLNANDPSLSFSFSFSFSFSSPSRLRFLLLLLLLLFLFSFSCWINILLCSVVFYSVLFLIVIRVVITQFNLILPYFLISLFTSALLNHSVSVKLSCHSHSLHHTILKSVITLLFWFGLNVSM